jgi:polysaccharide biosynthesis/export protein
VARLLALFLIPLALLASGLRAEDELPITAGDRLAITVAGEEDLTDAYTVDADGTIAFPMVGKVPVAGKTSAQVREDLTKRLARFVRDPQIRVEFGDRAQITVGFTGAVGKPGPVKLKKGSRLLDGLAEAAGLALDADPQRVSLQTRAGKTAQTLDLTKVLSGEAKLNVELQDGDAIFVPRIQMNVIRVLGAIQKPGEVQRKENPTLLEAVLAGGGLTPDADRKRAQILRKGKAEPELVNLDDVFSGKIPNPVLRDGDTITVPAQSKLTVKVFGSVTTPGEREMKTGVTVLEALTAAGGFNMEADKRSVMLTDKNGEVKKLTLDTVSSPDGAVKLEEGMQIYVPKAALRRFAVAGGVNEPGLFPFPEDPKEKIYLTDALAQAKGPVERAKMKQVVVVRKDPNGGQPKPITIDVEKLLKKKEQALNIELQVNDVVYVDVEPERGERRSTLDRILGIAGSFFFGL